MAEQKCPHGRIPDKCSPCLRADDARFPTVVLITEKGDTFHAHKDCEVLVTYQTRAARRGANASYEAREVPQSEARFTLKRLPCEFCFPE